MEKTISFWGCRLNQVLRYSSSSFISTGESRIPTYGGLTDDPLYTDMPLPRRRKSDRKPYLTPMNVLIKRAKEERELRKAMPCRILEHPPENGLLLPELVSFAHQTYCAWDTLLVGIPKLLQSIPIKRCRFCFEVHVGPVVHNIRTCTGPKSGSRGATHVWRRGSIHDVVYFPKCYHLFDRVGRPRVVHDDRLSVPRIPAILELCIQAGMDVKEYPTKRRTRPVYCIEGRIVDFEAENEDGGLDLDYLDYDTGHVKVADPEEVMDGGHKSGNSGDETLRDISNSTLTSWFKLINGARMLMEKYKVWTCGYCPEIQVGPKGHKVRMCKASKHQTRDGMHAWQDAMLEDLIGPNYVWHVRDLSGPPLENELKRYYGKAPALVELCIQGGADVPDEYRSMMRLDVVPPDRDEADLVV